MMTMTDGGDGIYISGWVMLRGLAFQRRNGVEGGPLRQFHRHYTVAWNIMQVSVFVERDISPLSHGVYARPWDPFSSPLQGEPKYHRRVKLCHSLLIAKATSLHRS